jgi:hypothetical protein
MTETAWDSKNACKAQSLVKKPEGLCNVGVGANQATQGNIDIPLVLYQHPW